MLALILGAPAQTVCVFDWQTQRPVHTNCTSFVGYRDERNSIRRHRPFPNPRVQCRSKTDFRRLERRTDKDLKTHLFYRKRYLGAGRVEVIRLTAGTVVEPLERNDAWAK
jgi:hypothetical protein